MIFNLDGFTSIWSEGEKIQYPQIEKSMNHLYYRLAALTKGYSSC